MINNSDLKELTAIFTFERTFISLYLAGPQSVEKLDKIFAKFRNTLKKEETEHDELEHFDENIKLIFKYLKKNPLKSGSLAIFSGWVLNYFKVIPLNIKIQDLIWIDSSPYIRPLAELEDEYENVAVVIADNNKSRIFMVSSSVAGSEKTIKGNVKNHVRKGGWSQQRYERRRDKQLLLYAREIVDVLAKLEIEEKFRRILLVGSKETLQAIYNNMPQVMQNKTADKAMDLKKGDNVINKDILDLFIEQERKSEQDLWDKIRTEYLKGCGLAVVGLDNVFEAVKSGRIEKMIVNRTFKPEGQRCSDCNNIEINLNSNCSACNSNSVFRVDIINEIVEMLKSTKGEVDFCDPIKSLINAGEVAAFLRY